MNIRHIVTTTISHRFVLLGTRKGVVLLEDDKVLLLIASDLMSGSELSNVMIGDVLLGEIKKQSVEMKYDPDPLFEEPSANFVRTLETEIIKFKG